MSTQKGSVHDSGVPPYTYKVKEVPYGWPTRMEGSYGPQLLIMQVDAKGQEYLFGEFSGLGDPREINWAIQALNSHKKLRDPRKR